MRGVNRQKSGGCRNAALLVVACLLAACGNEVAAPPSTPVIVVQPADVSVVAGSAASFSVTATGDTPDYQWQTSADDGTRWSAISGATATSYTLATTTLGDSGRLFRVLVTAAGATVASSPARLTVTAAVEAPAITVQPAGQTVTEPATATFSVTATGTAPQYQWQLSENGSDWSDISGATTSSYITPATSVSASGTQFRVQISNTAGSVTSNAAVLTVEAAPSTNVAPSFPAQPASQSVTAGSSATFSASVNGTPTPALQWQRSNDSGASWTDIVYAVSNHYTTPATTVADDSAQFRLIATNSEGSATSNAATLTVTAANAAPIFTTQPQDTSVSPGGSAHFSVAASGVPAPTYQWQMSTDSGANWNSITGANAAGYDTPATTAGDDGRQFRAVASNSEGTVYSSVATLTVSQPVSGWQGVQEQGMGDLYSIRLVHNAKGQAALIWTGDTGNGHGVFLRRYDPAGGWGAAESVVANAYNYDAGMDNQGNVTVAWVWTDVDTFSQPQRAFAIRYTVGSGWGAPIRQPLPDATANGPGNGKAVVFGGVAVNPAGSVTVLWSQYDSPCNCGRLNIVAAAFDAGAWGDLHVLYAQTDEGGLTYYPSGMKLAVGPNGHAVLLWARRSDSGPADVWASHFTAGETSGNSVAIASMLVNTDISDQTSDIAVDAAGDAIAAWEEYDNDIHRQRVRLSRYDGAWEAPQWMSSDSTEITRGPNVAYAATGDALVSAASFLSSVSTVDWRVVALPYSASSGWGTMQLVQDTGSNFKPLTFGAIDPHGVFALVYQDGGGFIRASQHALDDAWTTPEIISATPGNSGAGNNSLRVIGLPDGDVLAAWTAPNTQPPYSIRTNVFKAAP